MSENWHYVQAGVKTGPVSTEQLKSMLASGQILPTDNVWKEGMPNWQMAGQVPGLMPTMSPPPVSPGVPEVGGPPPVKASLPGVNQGLRIVAIVGAGLALLSFFTPYFYAWATPHVALKVGDVDVPNAEALNKSGSAAPFGWAFWWGILIFVFAFLPLAAAILDLCLKNAVVRTINKWVMLGVFSVITLLALVNVPLAIFGLGIGNIPMYTKDDPEPASANDGEDSLAKLRKAWRDAAKNGTKDQKDAAEKAARDTYVSSAAVPIGSILPLLGGAAGLVASMMIISRKQ